MVKDQEHVRKRRNNLMRRIAIAVVGTVYIIVYVVTVFSLIRTFDQTSYIIASVFLVTILISNLLSKLVISLFKTYET